MIGGLIKTGIGWATGGSLWPVGIALAAGIAVGAGGAGWVASFVVGGARETATAQTERADNLGKLLNARNLEVANRDLVINELSAQLDEMTTQAAVDQAAALALATKSHARTAELETALGKARKLSHDEALSANSRSALVWLRCWQRSPDDVHAAARCSVEAGLSAD